jgi:spore coat protein CotF
MSAKGNLQRGAMSAKGGSQRNAMSAAGSGRGKMESGRDNALSDVDIATDILTTQKDLVKRYGTALTEVDNQKLRGVLSSQLTECADDQFDTFTYMSKHGMYPTEQAPQQKVDKAKKMFGDKDKQFDK